MTTAYTSDFAPGKQKEKILTLSEWQADSDDYTASLHFLYVKVTSTGSQKLYLHSSPVDGEEIVIADHTGSCSGQPIEIRVGNNAHTIISAPDGIGINTDYGLLCLKYIDANTWVVLYGR
ncbi:MAG: hypothetical protein EB127_02185 [Alphaproteobacteria bacterium]|nr:hypothetical protein [Alphaproteobacteria bacterium]